MLGYRKACCCTFDSYSALKQTIRPQEWLCHSRLRMVQSLQITGVKRNVLFLQKVRMQKLINGSMRNVSRSGRPYPNIVHNVQSPALKQTRLPYIRYQGFAGIRDNPLSRIHPLVEWWKVESTMLECRKGCKCSESFFSCRRCASAQPSHRPESYAWWTGLQSRGLTNVGGK